MSLYTIDLFISYAHIDNQPMAAGQAGWISRFHEALDTLLCMRLGKRVKIWRDDKLQGNDRFADEIVQQFDSTAVLVSVLSPRYLRSEWCTREVDEFCKRAQAGLFVENKARVFKILKTPVELEHTLPPVMRDILGYDFFVFEDGVPMELDSIYGQQYGQDFNRQVNKLAYEITKLLKQLDTVQQRGPERGDPAENSKPVVYLAECTFDMRQTRDVIETQLKCLGYSVLPDKHLPRDEQAYIEAVDALLELSDVSVHLIGEQYGAVPDGPSDRSTAIVQNALAAKRSEQSNLKRLIWLENALANSDLRQQTFIDSLQTKADVQRGADLLSGNIETLKSALQSLLDKIENDNQPPEEEVIDPQEKTGQEHALYLICTEQDRKATVPLRKYLREQGVRVSMPAFKGDAAEVRQINQQLLTSSQSIMIFYGEGEEAWKRSIDTEVRKLPAYLDDKPMPRVFTYLASPCTCDKEDLIDMDETGVINGLESLPESQLASLCPLSETTASLS